MPLNGGFDQESIKIIIEALQFIMKKILEDLPRKKRATDPIHYGLIDSMYRKEIIRIERAIVLLQKEANYSDYFMYELPNSADKELMSILRSALEVYLKDMSKTKADTGSLDFDSKIKEVKRIVTLDGLEFGNTDLFDNYYQAPKVGPEGKMLEIFLSYSNKDKFLAGKIAKILGEKDIDVFLAHEDIEVSQEWRIEILKHLNSDNFLVSLLTDNYETSTWANQEAGYMMGKGGKVISLIVGDTDVKKFGFLESLQGITIEDENFEVCADKIVEMLLK